MNILAIAAHPDDVEFYCAGTLALLHRRGHRIHLAIVANGCCGSATLPAAEISRIRHGEAQAAADLIEATLHWVDIPDLEVCFDNPTRRKVTEVVRRAEPELVITHYPTDYMLDHEMTSTLARDATFTASLPNYATGVEDPGPILFGFPHLYYMSPIDGVDPFGQPVHLDYFVDVTEAIGIKSEMLCCHATQREWLRQQHGMDEYVEHMKRESMRMGNAWGYAYAEGYRQHRGHAYPKDNLLQALLEKKP